MSVEKVKRLSTPRKEILNCLGVSVLVGVLGVAVGRIMTPDLAFRFSFFSCAEALAVVELLTVSLFTYYVIYKGSLTGPVAVFVSGGFTTLTSFLSIAFASVPHLHVACLSLLIGGYCVFDLFAIASTEATAGSNSGDSRYRSNLKEWFFTFNLPTFIAFLVLYGIVAVHLRIEHKETFPNSYVVMEAFVAGAAAFHIALSGVLFAIAHWPSLWKQRLEKSS